MKPADPRIRIFFIVDTEILLLAYQDILLEMSISRQEIILAQSKIWIANVDQSG